MTDDFGSGARWTVDLWPYDAIVLFDWLMTVDFDQIPVEHKAQRQALADLLTVPETQVPVAGVTQAQIDKAQDEASKTMDLCVPKTSSTSRDEAVFVDQATGVGLPSDAVPVEVDRFW